MATVSIPAPHPRSTASPAFAHWETFFRRTGADRAGHVHVAASLFHDIEPAAALGLPCVWINRLGESSQIPRAAELPDLSALPRRSSGSCPLFDGPSATHGGKFEDHDGHAIAVVALNIADDDVQTIRAVANPEKLRHLDRPTPPG